MTPVAHCANHPDQPSVATCTRCGRFMCRSCRTGLGSCTECLARELPSGSGRAALAVKLLRVMLVSEAAYTVISAVRYASPSSQVALIALGLAAIVQLALLTTTAVAFLRWWHLTVRHALARGAELDASPGLAVGVWFIPIVNLFRPRRLADHMASVVEGGAAAPIDTWWTLWVIWNVGGQISARLGGATSPTFLLVEVARGLIGAAAAWYAAQVVQVLQAGLSRPPNAS